MSDVDPVKPERLDVVARNLIARLNDGCPIITDPDGTIFVRLDVAVKAVRYTAAHILKGAT